MDSNPHEDMFLSFEDWKQKSQIETEALPLPDEVPPLPNMEQKPTLQSYSTVVTELVGAFQDLTERFKLNLLQLAPLEERNLNLNAQLEDSKRRGLEFQEALTIEKTRFNDLQSKLEIEREKFESLKSEYEKLQTRFAELYEENTQLKEQSSKSSRPFIKGQLKSNIIESNDVSPLHELPLETKENVKRFLLDKSDQDQSSKTDSESSL